MENGGLTHIQLLIFDLDGTLIDSEQDLTESVNAMRRQWHLEPLSRQAVASYVGQGVPTLVRRALGSDEPEESVQKAIAFFLQHYRNHMLDHTVCYPGVREALEGLRRFQLSVLTNKPVNFSREILAGLKLNSYFSFVYGGNSFDQKKPDPGGVLRLMRDTGAESRQTLIVGDSLTDIQTGRNAGIWTCGVTYGIGSPTLRGASPDVVVDDLRELAPLLNGVA